MYIFIDVDRFIPQTTFIFELLHQFRYAVQDEVGGYTIVMYFHTAMVN